MICWRCDEFEAHAVCAVCGRAVCRYCAQERLLPLVAIAHNGTVKMTGSTQAIWCGYCEVLDPIDAPEFLGECYETAVEEV